MFSSIKRQWALEQFIILKSCYLIKRSTSISRYLPTSCSRTSRLVSRLVLAGNA